MAISVMDTQYREALQEFGLYLQWLHRGAGEPSYAEVAKACQASTATVHRYLHGKILPRWNFLQHYLHEYGQEIADQYGTGAAADLKTRWMAVRNILNPIPAPPGITAAPVRRLTAVPDSEPPETVLRKLA